MNRKFYVLSFFIAFVLINAKAQEYGNEWIVSSQKYYKLSTAQDGIYRITYNELASIGFPVNRDPRNIQIFHRGVEQAIIIEDQTDASFDPDDYIEFYGKKNDGTLDQELYIDPGAHKRKYHNFYSDTTAYFLTWSLSETGKRMERPFDEDNVLNLPAEPHHINEINNIFTESYAAGLRYPIGGDVADSYLSAFDYGEGWTGTFFTKGQSRDVIFSGLGNVVKTGPEPVLEVLLTGGNNRPHTVSLSVGPNQSSLRSLADVNFEYLYDTMLIESLEWTDFSGDELVCKVSIPDNGVADRIAISYARLRFADAWDQESLGQKVYNVMPSVTNRSYVEIQNVPVGAEIFDITGEGNCFKIIYNRNGNDIDFVIPNDNNGRKLLITSNRIQVPKIEVASMRTINAAQADFLLVTNRALRKSTSNYPDVPKAYASYRASTAGGGYDTLLISIDQVYNMFSYGEYTSLAIYRFCRYMAEKGDPKYLFIIGKGLSGPNLITFRNGSALEPTRDLVPTAGFPGTDVLFTAGLKGTSYEAGFPVGRIAAETPSAVEAYFEKVVEMENTPHDQLWRKELVHLSGGKTVYEQRLFRRYVDGFKVIAEGEMLGGDVETISKTTSGATEIINIAEQVNAGKMLITFFGHSGTGGTDIGIGYVSEGYTNKGKYPMLMVNGCNAGDMFTNNSTLGFGEDWVLAPGKGAIGFIAHTNNGLTSYLRRYTSTFYEVAFTDSLYLNKGVGDLQKHVGKKYLQNLGPDPNEIDIAQIQQMALHGDPAVSLFGVAKPDYEINSDNVFAKSIDGDPINVFTESFKLGLIVRNFGATHRDSVKVSINRKLSNGQDMDLDTLIFKPVFYKDTLYFDIESVGIDGFGINQFTITVDPLNEVEELNEANNQTVYELFIPLGGTNNLVPTKYAITNKKELKLIAQSLDLLMENRTYLFELDTTNLFNSAYRKQASIQGNSLAKWSVNLFENLVEQDTVVFYWRTKFANPRPDELELWNTSSFTFISNGFPGWAMAHFQQFDGNETDNIVINQDKWIFEFEKSSTSIHVRTFGKLHPDFDILNVELEIDNTQYLIPTTRLLCDDNSMILASFRKTTTIPYLVLGTPTVLDPLSCGITPQSINTLSNSRIQNNLMIEQYIDRMGDGDFVVLFSIGNVTFQSWPATTIAKLSEIGVNSADMENMVDGEPIIIRGQKGTPPGSANIVTADYSSPTPAVEQEIALEDEINGQAISGTINSPKIGPASMWASFHQKTKNAEIPITDDYSFKIVGIDDTDNESVLFSNVQSNEIDLQGISVSTYPFLRVEMETSDETHLTPTQLANWFVLYDGVPEGILSYTEGQAKQGIELSEGKIHEASFVFENVSDLSFMDSVAIEYSLFNQSTRRSYTDTIMVKPLNAEESADFTLQIGTFEKVGKNDLKVFANPYVQQEQSYNNNIINFTDYLLISSDNINPILEVTVDGEFIMDGDIVSPSPMITLRMKDENGTLFKEDTLGVNIYLNEKEQVPTRISFSSPDVVWNPATAESDFTVEYQPQSLADGVYVLRAEAADASGNPSGSEPYSVNFEIVNESQITNFFPYPNPFSSRTQFVFTLTGSEIPDEIIIQIMTVNGTVVREITQDEMGPIKIGHNRTEYAWDGHDEYGDQLANGVYLYKVKIFNNGNEMNHRSTSADKAFKNGVGKLYLLR